MTIHDGIVTAMRECWRPGDDVERLRFTTPIGRARVRLAGDVEVDAFLVASNEPATLGDKFVAFFEPATRRLIVLPFERMEVADGR